MKFIKSYLKPALPGRVWVGLLLAFCLPFSSNAQSTEIQQLLLNVEKLSQFKNILSDMKNGYQILNTGYNAVKNISQGNFNLHEVFIDGLMLVSPEVRKYHKVADIITYQKDIVSEYKTAFNRFKASGTFSEQEITYLSKVYGQLFDQSINNLNALMNVVTSSKLRMSDDERLQAIDKIFIDTQDKLSFLRDFNQQASMLNLQRQKEKNDIQTLQKIYQP
ncbi:TerB family tellurite resistance protein [Pedobacter jamesrossensis]|uniref:TerB family tellurite resistance protein n=1 Tax=Pedobacter jamesrossensis TaxID=1908238 RepID=A0ABV8NPD6_9SPHI